MYPITFHDAPNELQVRTGYDRQCIRASLKQLTDQGDA
jgi:hypothetical protein